MALKAHYPATNRGKKDLLRDVTSGDLIYVIHDRATPWNGNAKTFSEYVVTHKKSWISDSPVIVSTATGGDDYLASLLARERDIYRDRPDLERSGLIEPMDIFDHSAFKAEMRHREELARKKSQELSAHYRQFARR